MNCLLSDCCLTNTSERYERAKKYINQAEKLTNSNKAPLLSSGSRGSYITSIGDMPAPTKAQLKLYYKAIALLQKCNRWYKADYYLGMLYGRGIADPTTRAKLNGEKTGLFAKCCDLFKPKLPVLPSSYRQKATQPKDPVLDMAIALLSSAKSKGHPKAAAPLAQLEREKQYRKEKWEGEISWGNAISKKMDDEENRRRTMQAIRDVERDYEARAARERLIRDNPQIPLLEQIARNQADIRDELQRLGRR